MPLPPFQPAVPMSVIFAITGAAALLAILRTFRGRELRPSWLKAPLLLLRLAALALLAAVLMNPSRPTEIPAPSSRSIVLIDKSASMSMGAPGKSTRWEDGASWVDRFSKAAATAGLPAPVVIPFAATADVSATALSEIKPDGRETNLAGALSSVLSTVGAAPVGHVFIVSDGAARDRAALPEALSLASAQKVPISTLAVGSDTPPRNAWIDAVQAPRIVRPNSRIAVHVTLCATGFSPSEKLPLVVKDESGAVVAQGDFRVPEVATPGGMATVERTLVFDSGLRTTHYTLELGTAKGEVSTGDNKFAFTVESASAKLRVLFVEGTHVKRTLGTTGHAINDMELMTRAWDATGEIEAECLTPVSEYLNAPNLIGVTFANGEMIPDTSRTFPTRREDLYNFDVMLISDVPVGNFSKEQMEWVVDWVNERGGGFLMGGGFTTFDSGRYDQTPWEKITPVDMVQYGAGYDTSHFSIAIPEAVKNHPIWRIAKDPVENERILATHPRFVGMNRIRRAKPGAIVFATRPDRGNEPVFAGQTYGRGRSIAYLPDPNGGWARYFVAWGPPGGPQLGPQQELGHGSDFKVDQSALRSAVGPVPPYPSPYYGQFWVNVVNWLGENSVRWRRDKLAGRAVVAQAQPDKDLPVAAEVLAVSKPEELLALDVGARLNLPDNPRVRLEYDRDRREFVGQVHVPADVKGDDVSVVFDVAIAGESLTDTARVGLSRVNPEWVDAKPDRDFLAQIAHATNGAVLGSPDEAVVALRKSTLERAQQLTQMRWQPLWMRWPWWAALMLLLGLEWALRRLGGRFASKAAAAVAALLIFCPAAQSAESSTGKKSVPALVAQLGARFVRERDEAEAELKKRFLEAAAALTTAAKSSDSEEIRLRATNILCSQRQYRWTLEKTLDGHSHPAEREVYGLAVAPDQRHFFTRGFDFVRKWNAETFAPEGSFGISAEANDGWRSWAIIRTLTVSHDGKLVVATDDAGALYVYRVTDGGLVIRMVRDAPGRIWNAEFFPDDQRIATSDRNGRLAIWDLKSGKLITEKRAPQGDVLACALGISPNGKFIVVSIDLSWEPDVVAVYDVQRGGWCASTLVASVIYNIAFNRAGTEFLGGSRIGAVLRWKIGPDGQLSEASRIGSINTEVAFATYSADEKSILATSDSSPGELAEWDAKTGEELWRSRPLGVPLRKIARLGTDRIIVTAADGKVRIWHSNPELR